MTHENVSNNRGSILKCLPHFPSDYYVLESASKMPVNLTTRHSTPQVRSGPWTESVDF